MPRPIQGPGCTRRKCTPLQRHRHLQSGKHGRLRPQSSARQQQTACQRSIWTGRPHTNLGLSKGWAVVGSNVVMDWHSSHLDHPAKLVHLINTLGAGKPCIWSSQGSCNEEGEEKHCLHVLRFVDTVPC